MTTTKKNTETLYTKLIITPETNARKNFSMWMMLGGAIVFTLFAVAALVMVKEHPEYVFWFGILAHVQVFSILAGYIAQLVKRRILVSKDGVTIEDTSSTETTTHTHTEAKI